MNTERDYIHRTLSWIDSNLKTATLRDTEIAKRFFTVSAHEAIEAINMRSLRQKHRLDFAAQMCLVCCRIFTKFGIECIFKPAELFATTQQLMFTSNCQSRKQVLGKVVKSATLEEPLTSAGQHRENEIPNTVFGIAVSNLTGGRQICSVQSSFEAHECRIADFFAQGCLDRRSYPAGPALQC